MWGVFENGVIIMDDIDLYLGSRDNGSIPDYWVSSYRFLMVLRKEKLVY
jgi:hypothetical protein